VEKSLRCELHDVSKTTEVTISGKDNSASPVPIKNNEIAKNRRRPKRSSGASATLKQIPRAPATLLMKPSAVLYLPVVILPSFGHSSFTSGRQTKPASIAPKLPVDSNYSTLTTSSRLGANGSSVTDSCLEFRSELVSSIGTQCSLTDDGLGLKGTHCSLGTNVLGRKVAETQTVPCVGLRETSSRQFKKAASQVRDVDQQMVASSLVR